MVKEFNNVSNVPHLSECNDPRTIINTHYSLQSMQLVDVDHFHLCIELVV